MTAFQLRPKNKKKSSTLAVEKGFNWFYIIAFVLLVVGFLSRFIM